MWIIALILLSKREEWVAFKPNPNSRTLTTYFIKHNEKTVVSTVKGENAVSDFQIGSILKLTEGVGWLICKTVEVMVMTVR